MVGEEVQSKEGARLRGVVFSLFDPVVGPTVAFQHPQQTLSPAQFDSMTDFLIPKPQVRYAPSNGPLRIGRWMRMRDTFVCVCVCIYVSNGFGVRVYTYIYNNVADVQSDGDT